MSRSFLYPLFFQAFYQSSADGNIQHLDIKSEATHLFFCNQYGNVLFDLNFEVHLMCEFFLIGGNLSFIAQKCLIFNFYSVC